MTFYEWLVAETDAIAELEKMERGEIPVGPVEFRKANGTSFYEFVEFVKRDDGQETHVIANSGGLEMLERDSMIPDGPTAAGQLAGLDKTIDTTLAKVADLSKRVDTMTADRADSVEVSPADLARLFAEAVTEAGAD